MFRPKQIKKKNSVKVSKEIRDNIIEASDKTQTPKSFSQRALHKDMMSSVSHLVVNAIFELVAVAQRTEVNKSSI